MPKPRRPRSAYNYFFKARLREVQAAFLKNTGSKGAYPDTARVVARMWSDVPAHERAHCENLAAQDKRRFALELVQWQMEQEASRRANNEGSDATQPNVPQEDARQDMQDCLVSIAPGVSSWPNNTQDGNQDASSQTNMKQDARNHAPRLDHSNAAPRVQPFPTMNVYRMPRGSFPLPSLHVRPIEAMAQAPEDLMITWTQRDLAHLKKALGMR